MKHYSQTYCIIFCCYNFKKCSFLHLQWYPRNVSYGSFIRIGMSVLMLLKWMLTITLFCKQNKMNLFVPYPKTFNFYKLCLASNHVSAIQMFYVNRSKLWKKYYLNMANGNNCLTKMSPTMSSGMPSVADTSQYLVKNIHHWTLWNHWHHLI